MFAIGYPSVSSQGQALLDSVAVHGGSGGFVISSGDIGGEFLDALNAIRGSALGCEYVMPKAAEGTVTPAQVEVMTPLAIRAMSRILLWSAFLEKRRSGVSWRHGACHCPPKYLCWRSSWWGPLFLSDVEGDGPPGTQPFLHSIPAKTSIGLRQKWHA